MQTLGEDGGDATSPSVKTTVATVATGFKGMKPDFYRSIESMVDVDLMISSAISGLDDVNKIVYRQALLKIYESKYDRSGSALVLGHLQLRDGHRLSLSLRREQETEEKQLAVKVETILRTGWQVQSSCMSKMPQSVRGRWRASSWCTCKAFLQTSLHTRLYDFTASRIPFAATRKQTGCRKLLVTSRSSAV